MLAQLKTVVLIEEAIQMASFRLVEYMENQHLWVRLQTQNELFLFWEMKAIPCVKLPRNWRSRTTLCITPFTEQNKLALNGIERGVGGPSAQLSKRTSTLVSSSGNRCFTSPQLTALLNSTHKTPVSTVKRRLQDAGPSRQSWKKAISQTGQ
jgi:hypothetical protein